MPEPKTISRSNGEIALAELDWQRAVGVRFSLVLADAVYGESAAFRNGLDARGLRWAVGIPCNQKVYRADVQLVPPPDASAALTGPGAGCRGSGAG